MPRHTIFAEDGSLSDKTKEEIAEEITRIHAEVMKVPKSFVRVVFLSYATGCGYTAGEKAPTVALNCILRVGHTAQEKNDMLKKLWSMFQQLTGVAKEQFTILLQKIPSNNTM